MRPCALLLLGPLVACSSAPISSALDAGHDGQPPDVVLPPDSPITDGGSVTDACSLMACLSGTGSSCPSPEAGSVVGASTWTQAQALFYMYFDRALIVAAQAYVCAGYEYYGTLQVETAQLSYYEPSGT